MFHLRQPSQSGGSIGDELRAVEKLTGQKQPQLNYPELPREFESILSHYNKISDTSDSGILAYSNLMQVKLSPNEVEMIKDISYINQALRAGKKPEQIPELFGYGVNHG